MQEELVKLVPAIKESAEAAAKKEEVVLKEKEKADILAEGISKEEAIVQVDVDKATAIKKEVNDELEKALPDLMAAEDALKKIDKKATDFIKALNNPPEAIRVTMKAICLILYPNPGRKQKNPYF